MKPLYSLLVIATCLCLAAPANAAAESGPVYIIPVKGEIERGLVYVIRRGVAEAERRNARAIILDMNTPGGRLDAAQDIVELVAGAKTKTYTFCNPDAISAGAIIALATDEIYMSPGGRIGDAMPILISPIGEPQAVPEGIREKALSPTVALVRSVAQRKNRDPNLAEAMVRPEKGYVVDGKIICPTNQLLTLTSQDAAQPVGTNGMPLLSSGTVGDLDELIRKTGMESAPRVTISITVVEHIARAVESFPLSGIILALGCLAIYIEIKTPGFGVPGISGILLLGLWFWGHHIAGLAGMGELMFFVIGIVLIIIEVFLLPGFGVVGVAGIIAVTASLIMAMVEHLPGTTWYSIPPRQLSEMIWNLGVTLLGTAIVGALLAKILPKTPLYGRIVLAAAEHREHGYHASSEDAGLTGLKGTASTPLRPAGIGIFDGRRLDVVTRGEFIDAGTEIVVAEARGSRIVVEVLKG